MPIRPSKYDKSEECKAWRRDYMRKYMAKVRANCPKIYRKPWLDLGYAFKAFSKTENPDFLMTRHPLAICTDAFPAFRDMVDPSPDPFEAMCQREEAA